MDEWKKLVMEYYVEGKETLNDVLELTAGWVSPGDVIDYWWYLSHCE